MSVQFDIDAAPIPWGEAVIEKDQNFRICPIGNIPEELGLIRGDRITVPIQWPVIAIDFAVPRVQRHPNLRLANENLRRAA